MNLKGGTFRSFVVFVSFFYDDWFQKYLPNPEKHPKRAFPGSPLAGAYARAPLDAAFILYSCLFSADENRVSLVSIGPVVAEIFVRDWDDVGRISTVAECWPPHVKQMELFLAIFSRATRSVGVAPRRTLDTERHP